MAPRLRKQGQLPERQVKERELRKAKARIAELEKRIADVERAVKELEARMASPELYSDRERAAQVAAEHQAAMWQAGDLMSQWEALQQNLQELE
jgi:ATP-binding cassette subfamily F protein 3